MTRVLLFTGNHTMFPDVIPYFYYIKLVQMTTYIDFFGFIVPFKTYALLSHNKTEILLQITLFFLKCFVHQTCDTNRQIVPAKNTQKIHIIPTKGKTICGLLTVSKNVFFIIIITEENYPLLSMEYSHSCKRLVMPSAMRSFW